MLFCHIVDDYYLQGILAQMKQKVWWEKEAPQRMYRYDYIVALVMHSISWSFMIMLPIAIKDGFDVSIGFVAAFFINAIVHGIVDDMKANKRTINLMTDQMIHIVQIIVTALLLL